MLFLFCFSFLACDVLNWRGWLTQVDLYYGCKMLIVVVLLLLHAISLLPTFGTCCLATMNFDLWNTHLFNGPFPGLPRWADTRKVKPVWILLKMKQETVSGIGISWAICKSAPHSRQITTPAPHHSVFYMPDALPATQPTASKHWRH